MTEADVNLPASARLRALGRRALGLRWVPVTASLVSLILSLVAIFVSTQQPDVTLVLPDQIRVAQGRWVGAAFVYLQPAFVSTGRNERIEVIRDMTLRVEPAGGPPVELAWTEQVRFTGNATSNGLAYEYAGDAVPLLVSPRSAAAPIGLFQAPAGFFFAAGTYTLTLSADRVVAGSPLSATFRMTLTDEHIAAIDPADARRFVSVAIEQVR
jgi:hypothetical protein